MLIAFMHSVQHSFSLACIGACSLPTLYLVCIVFGVLTLQFVMLLLVGLISKYEFCTLLLNCFSFSLHFL